MANTVGSDNPFPSVLFAEHVDPATPGAGTHRVFVDTDGDLKKIDEAAAVVVYGASFSGDAGDIPFTPAGTIAATDVQAAIEEVASEAAGGGGTGQGLVDFGTAKRTSGNITANSTTWAALDTGLDIVLTAAAGDFIEVGASFLVVSGSPSFGLDVATIVSAAVVTSLSGAGGASDFGVSAWSERQGSGFWGKGGSIIGPALVSGDISGGTVTLRLMYRTNVASNKVIGANSNEPFHWYAKNLGPAL